MNGWYTKLHQISPDICGMQVFLSLQFPLKTLNWLDCVLIEMEIQGRNLGYVRKLYQAYRFPMVRLEFKYGVPNSQG